MTTNGTFPNGPTANGDTTPSNGNSTTINGISNGNVTTTDGINNGNITTTNGINNDNVTTTNVINDNVTTNPPIEPMTNPTAANISIREYIYYLPHPLPPDTPIPYTPGLPTTNPLNLLPYATEPTSTLVLTSPRSTFVDIRLLKPHRASDAPLPNTGGPLQRLEWAFAGTSKSWDLSSSQPISTKIAEEGEEEEEEEMDSFAPIHTVWNHWLDSHFPAFSSSIPIDEGDMYPMSPDLVLEHGCSFNGALGAMQSYEEMWRDLPIASCFPSQSKFCIVLRTEHAGAGVRGLVIRLGQFCQGIVMKGSQVTIERWEFVETKDGEVVDGNWTRVARIGDLFLPCAVTFQPEGLTLGTRATYGDYQWFVEELDEWVHL